MQTVQIRLPTELYESFREVATQRGQKTGAVIRHAAMVGFWKIKDGPKKEKPNDRHTRNI